jgi:hypothetical protein
MPRGKRTIEGNADHDGLKDFFDRSTKTILLSRTKVFFLS